MTKVSESELELTKRAHCLCNLVDSADGTPLEDRENPLNGLQLNDLFSAVFFVASLYRSTINLKSRRVLIAKFGDGLRNADIHHLLSRAVLVFQNWPVNYFNFLAWRKENLHSTTREGGLWKDFGPLQSALYAQLSARSFDFLRHAFEEYITTIWDGGYTRQFRWLDRTASRNKKFVSLNEAKQLLKLGSGKMDCLLRDGNLTAKIRENGRGRVVLVETKSINQFKALREDLLDRKQTAKRLGISTIQTRILIEANLLTKYDSFDGRSSAIYSIKEIDELVNTLINLVRPIRSTKPTQTISFAQALYSLACHHDISVAEFIRAILKGAIKPRSIVAKPGFRALRFFRRDITQYQELICRKRYPDALNTLEAAVVLRTHPKIVRFLIEKNLLGAHRFRWWFAIPQTAISDFSSKYVLTQALAKELKTSTHYITTILETEGVEPISFTKVHNKPSYGVYNKSAIDDINLSTLIETKRQVVTLRSQLLDITSASRFLNIAPETLSKIITNGILTPHVTERRKHPEKGYFTLRHLRRLKGRVVSYDGLISMRVAAKTCSMSVNSLNARFVTKKRLGIFQVDSDRAPYFRKTDVEKLADELKNLLRPSDVRSLLELSQSRLLQLTRSRELTPVYGPSIDGSGVNLFLKSEVEALSRQRQDFKQKRVRDGGSARFGTPAGPRRRRVIDAIAPRVTQLVRGALADKNRVSGGSVHKQLLNEGYDVGINSVYVCLRNLRQSTGS